MALIQVNSENVLRPVKPLHGVGQPPFYGSDYSLLHYLTDAGIPFSRLHDVGGAFGGNLYVDIPNLFRNFDADPQDPASYDFAFTDVLMAKLAEYRLEPFFRLGVTIENYSHIKSYRIFPPKDNLKWAKICEGVIRHYTEGWADGFRYNIRYWEIWNEPDGHEAERSMMWKGTKEEYYELYAVTSRYLKEKFPHLKIGGYASCGFYGLESSQSDPNYKDFEYFMTFFDEFLTYIKERNCPMDFFSFHSYAGIESTQKHIAYARRKVTEAGYPDAELSLNEWNPDHRTRGSLHHAAQVTGMMLMYQDSALDNAMFYDARWGISEYGGMFNPLTREPFPAYYGFVAFNELYRLGTEVETLSSEEGLYAVSATDGKVIKTLLVNTSDHAIPLTLALGGRVVASCKVIDDGHNLEETPLPGCIPAESVMLLRF